MSYPDSAEKLGREFVTNPINFVTEVDLQVRLVELLRSTLETVNSNVLDPTLSNTSSSYKARYWQTAQEKLSTNGVIDRVHTEVSVQEGERLDVVAFEKEITEPIQWVSGGSKRFAAENIDAVFELKFVKNKYKFPTKTGVRIKELQEMEYDPDGLRQKLDFDENNIGPDIAELNRLDSVDNRFLLLFSNNNYLFDGTLSDRELNYKNSSLYSDIGEAAIAWMTDTLDSDVGLLYAHPRGSRWIQ